MDFRTLYGFDMAPICASADSRPPVYLKMTCPAWSCWPWRRYSVEAPSCLCSILKNFPAKVKRSQRRNHEGTGDRGSNRSTMVREHPSAFKR
jgi:hypothetical protein